MSLMIADVTEQRAERPNTHTDEALVDQTLPKKGRCPGDAV